MIGIAGFGCESISFWPDVVGLEAFERTAFHGRDVIPKARGTNSSTGGFIDVLEAEGVEILPVCDMIFSPVPKAADAVYDFYVGKMLETFSDAKDRLDGVLLAFHGAMVTESRTAPEADAARAIRQVVGDDIPIMVALDLHANIDAALVSQTNGVFGYLSSPHTDMAETGMRAARALVRTLAGEVMPSTVIRKPGIVVPSLYSATTMGPGRTIMDRVRDWQSHPGVLDVSAFFGFAWSDVPALGMSMVAITDGNPALAEEIADDLCRLAWRERDALTGRGSSALFSVEEGVRYALEQAATHSGPIVILDHADRTSDTTFVLRELIRQGARNAAHPLLYDPAAAQACIEAGVGTRVTVDAGGLSGWDDGGPVRLEGKVVWAGHARYACTGPLWTNVEMDLGPTAVIDADGIWVQLTSREMPLTDEDPFIQFGYDPRSFDVIVTKSKTHFRAVYEELAGEIVVVDAPGQCPADVTRFTYEHAPPDAFPLSVAKS